MIEAVPDVLPLLRDERLALIDLLVELDDAQWSSPTECPAWSVRDIALHLLGDDLALLARQRDAALSGLIVYAENHPGVGFRQLLDGFNEQWVTAARFFSGPLLLDLLRRTGEWTADYYEAVDPELLGEPVGMFSATDASPYWQIISREYVERWAHHHQIRRALGQPDLGPAFLRGAAAVITASLAPAMAGTGAEEGARITVDIPDVGSWAFVRTPDHWTVQPAPLGRAPASEGVRLALDERDATTVLSRGLDGGEVWAQFRVSGDQRLAELVRPLFSQILARPPSGPAANLAG